MKSILFHLTFALTWGRESTASLNHALTTLSAEGDERMIRRYIQALLVADDLHIYRFCAIWMLYRKARIK